MGPGLILIHSVLRWAVLLFGLLTLLTSLRGLNGKRDFTNGDKRTALYFLISADIQLLIGLALYFINGYYRNFNAGMAAVMSDAARRFWTVEHPVGMLLGIVLIHAGYAGTKGNRPHVKRFRRLFWCSLIALIVIAATIPWPGRELVGRSLFPGMEN